MKRLDKQRQEELEPKRIEAAMQSLNLLDLNPTIENETIICFKFRGSKIRFFPYTGWHTGKTIKDGRGLQNLLKQLS